VTEREENQSRFGTGMFRAVGQKFETSRVGEALISALVMVILLIGVVWSLPASEIQREAVPVLKPIAGAAGLEQDWRMFAPDPVKQLDLPEFHVTMADGTERVWTFQRGDPLLRAFTWGHWQKTKFAFLWTAPETRKDFAHWVVRQVTKPGERAVRVQVILRSYVVPPPPNEQLTTKVDTVYDENLLAAPQ
jgi:hypothetical protein